MRWLWRIIVVVAIIILVKNYASTPQQVFINWQKKNQCQERIIWQIKIIRKDAQDLPFSIEEEFKLLFQQETLPTDNYDKV